jgi:hypothetical protein
MSAFCKHGRSDTSTITACRECHEELKADLAAARADAKRYQWLRDERSSAPDNIIRNVDPAKWDAAIDAALAGKDET